MAPAIRVRVLGADEVRSRSVGAIDPARGLDPEQSDQRHLELSCAVPNPWFEGQPLRALPIPPAEQRGELEKVYAEVLACEQALREGWTAARERQLGVAIGRLFARVVGKQKRLALGAWVPEAIAGPVVPDPALELDQLGIPDPLARGFEHADELLVVIREASTANAVLSLRPVVIAADDRAFRVAPMLLAAMAERAELDACELELVVGRGRGLERLGPLYTLFSRPFAHNLVLPRSVALTVLAASLPHEPDELEDRKIRARLVEEFGWIADASTRAARLERARRLLHASLDDLSRAGSSLCHADLRDPLGDLVDATAELRAHMLDRCDRYNRGELSRAELRWWIGDEREVWVHRQIQALVGIHRVWDAPEGPALEPGAVRLPSLRGWASLDLDEPRRLLCAPDTGNACEGILPSNLVTGLDTHTWFATAQVRRRPVIERVVARQHTRAWARTSLAALRRPSNADAVEDCGLLGHESAATRLVVDEAPTLPPVIEHPPLPRPIPPGVLGCRAAWVCERCWSSVATGQAAIEPRRVALEFVRMFERLHGLWTRRYWSGPSSPRAWNHDVMGPGRVRIRGTRAPGWVESDHAEIEVDDGDSVRVRPLFTHERTLVANDTVLDRPTLVVHSGDYNMVELDAPITKFSSGHVIMQAPGQEARWFYARRFGQLTRELDYFGTTGKPFGYAISGYYGGHWAARVESHREWHLLLGEPSQPKELRAPFAGHLRIRRRRRDYEFEVTAPGRVWKARAERCEYPLTTQDDTDVYELQLLAEGYIDADELARRDPDGARWWVLEVLLGLSLHARTPVDWRALDLYARIVTTPPGTVQTLPALARTRGDLFTRMRVGSMFEELRAAVLHGPEPLHDPTSLAFVGLDPCTEV
jgi:hypothetical protein